MIEAEICDILTEYFKNKPQAAILKRIQFCVFKNLNTIQLYVFNLFHSLNGKTCQQNEETCTSYNWYLKYSKTEMS